MKFLSDIFPEFNYIAVPQKSNRVKIGKFHGTKEKLHNILSKYYGIDVKIFYFYSNQSKLLYKTFQILHKHREIFDSLYDIEYINEYFYFFDINKRLSKHQIKQLQFQNIL